MLGSYVSSLMHGDLVFMGSCCSISTADFWVYVLGIVLLLILYCFGVVLLDLV
jgi:hypothetical protein